LRVGQGEFEKPVSAPNTPQAEERPIPDEEEEEENIIELRVGDVAEEKKTPTVNLPNKAATDSEERFIPDEEIEEEPLWESGDIATYNMPNQNRLSAKDQNDLKNVHVDELKGFWQNPSKSSKAEPKTSIDIPISEHSVAELREFFSRLGKENKQSGEEKPASSNSPLFSDLFNKFQAIRISLSGNESGILAVYVKYLLNMLEHAKRALF
jgi:hypothetical protein